MDWLQVIVQWLHVFFGIFWFGSTLYADLILVPAVMSLPVARQREVVAPIGSRSVKLLEPVAGLVILLGFLRGTVFGQIRSLEALMTVYGVTWLVALVAAIALFYWAFRVLPPAIERMNAIPLDAEANEGSNDAFAAALSRVKRISLLELVGFLIIFTCMILMRFGL